MPAFEMFLRYPASAAATFGVITDLSQWSSFRGYGPVPGITKATLESPTMGAGARIRVENTDGSVHHEVFVDFVQNKKLHIRMELRPPASYVMAAIDETLALEEEPGGCRLHRRFEMTPRFWLTWPIAFVLCRIFLKRAAELHNAEVMRRLAAQSA